MGRSPQAQIVSGVWYKEGHQVVTGDLQDKWTIIKSHHDPLVYGHPRINKTTQLIE